MAHAGDLGLATGAKENPSQGSGDAVSRLGIGLQAD